MKTPAQAKTAAIAKLVECGFTAEIVLIESKTEEFDVGWVFYYQTARYLKTGDTSRMLVGCPPLFVPRSDAALQFITDDRPAFSSIEAFRCCGNPNAEANAEVELTGWTQSAARDSAIDAIRAHSSLDLATATEAVDCCLSGSPARVETSWVPAAHELVSRLAEIGFLAKVTYERR